jgi:hypothetical protein
MLNSVLQGNPTLPSTASIAQTLYNELQADGVSSITLGQISQSLNKAQANYAALNKAIQTKGIAAVESDMVQEFLMLSQITQGASTTSTAINGHRARLLLAVSEPLTQQQCANLAQLSSEATALAIIAALSGAEPVALAFEAAALAYDAEAAAGGCNDN